MTLVGILSLMAGSAFGQLCSDTSGMPFQPTDLMSVESSPGLYDLTWTTPDSATRCAVLGKNVAGPGSVLLNAPGIVDAVTTPLPPGAVFVWRVRCTCADDRPRDDISDWSDADTIVVPTDSIPRLAQEIDHQIWPNPVVSQLNVQSQEDATLHIFDQAGALVREVTVTAHQNAQIGLEELASGVYFYQLSSKSGMSAGEFLKQ